MLLYIFWRQEETANDYKPHSVITSFRNSEYLACKHICLPIPDITYSNVNLCYKVVAAFHH